MGGFSKGHNAFFRLTPNDGELCVFAVRRGKVGKRIDVNFNHPKYTNLLTRMSILFDDKMTVVGKISDVICGPFGSAITNKDYVDEGVPLLRITNITKNGYLDYSDLRYITKECANRLTHTQVSHGDIIISQRGTLGQCAIVNGKFDVLNISANLIAVKNIREINSEFLRNYILSPIGVALLQRTQSGQVQGKITTQDIADMPIPKVVNINKLNTIISNAYADYISALRKADALLSGMDEEVLARLGIGEIHYNDGLSTAVTLTMLKEDCTIGAEYYHPERMAIIRELERHTNFKTKRLADIVDFIRVIVKSTNSKLPYLGLSGVVSNTGELSGVEDEVDGQAFAYQTGDVLYARLRPYLNKVLYAQQDGICSTEFHVMRVNTKEVSPEYLAAIMRSSVIVRQTKHMMTGNTHPRISNDDVKNLRIPIPVDKTIQTRIVEEIYCRRNAAFALKQQAADEWKAARARFEQELLEGK